MVPSQPPLSAVWRGHLRGANRGSHRGILGFCGDGASLYVMRGYAMMAKARNPPENPDGPPWVLVRPPQVPRKKGPHSRGGWCWCSSPSGFFWVLLAFLLVFFWCSSGVLLVFAITQKNTRRPEEPRRTQKNTRRTPEEKPPPCPLLPLYKPKRQVTSSRITR